MKRPVEFPLEEEGSILVQIDEQECGGTVRAGREETIEKAEETFEDALNRVLHAARSVVEKLQGMGSRPHEIEVNFGINLITQSGDFLASATAQADFGMTVCWTGASREMVPAEGDK